MSQMSQPAQAGNRPSTAQPRPPGIFLFSGVLLQPAHLCPSFAMRVGAEYFPPTRIFSLASLKCELPWKPFCLCPTLPTCTREELQEQNGCCVMLQGSECWGWGSAASSSPETLSGSCRPRLWVAMKPMEVVMLLCERRKRAPPRLNSCSAWRGAPHQPCCALGTDFQESLTLFSVVPTAPHTE